LEVTQRASLPSRFMIQMSAPPSGGSCMNAICRLFGDQLIPCLEQDERSVARPRGMLTYLLAAMGATTSR
jgi:hypothetical protein